MDFNKGPMKQLVFPSPEKAVLEDSKKSIAPPAPNEVTVKTVGCGICQVEIKKYKGSLRNVFPEQELGHESVGYITAVGSEVEGLAIGDFVTTLWAPGFQEYFNVRSEWAIKLDPSAVENAAQWISEPAACALNGLISADVQAGEKVLLLGAGYMGQLLTQFFEHTPRSEFVVCDRIQSKLDLALEMGATGIINAANANIAEESMKRGYFDIVIEATGAPKMIQIANACVRTGGKVVVFADHRHNRDEVVDWAPFIEKAASIRISNPGSHPDFPGVWRKAVELMKAGFIDQGKLINYSWPIQDGAEAMQISSNPTQDYIKGYLSWT